MDFPIRDILRPDASPALKHQQGAVLSRDEASRRSRAELVADYTLVAVVTEP